MIIQLGHFASWPESVGLLAPGEYTITAYAEYALTNAAFGPAITGELPGDAQLTQYANPIRIQVARF